MIKHVGKHGDKKVVVLFRQVPGEDHMALVVYSDMLPRIYHDEVMAVVESPVGQQAEDLADALHRNQMPDGKNSLEALHVNGLIKKVQTNQIIMTPTVKSSVRLDELNDILNEMKKGDAAIKRLAEMDANKGMSGKRKREPQEVGVPPSSRSLPATEPLQASSDGVLSDADIARSQVQQAEAMKANAQSLLEEAERLMSEATKLDPSLAKSNVKRRPAKKKTEA